MVAFSRAFIFRSMKRNERLNRSPQNQTKFLAQSRKNQLDVHAQKMGYLDDEGNLTDLGKRLWQVLASDKNNKAIQ